MPKKFLVIVLLVVFAAVIVWAVFSKKIKIPTAQDAGQGGEQPIPAGNPEPKLPPKIVITFGADGFSPKVLKIKKDDMVEFKNESQKPVWPASALHPTHTAYPGSDVKKCGTSEAGRIFDTCRGLKPGESWFFRFNEKGEWKYHNHLNAEVGGTVVVE